MPDCAQGFFIGDEDAFLCGLAAQFSREIKTGLLQCEVAKGLTKFRVSLPDTPWLVVSGADQTELREIFDQRGMSHYFDAGIYGSPKDKLSIVEELLDSGQIHLPALCLGDSLLDYEVSKAFGLYFIFLHARTEFADWRNYCHRHLIPSISTISDLFDVC